MGSGLEGSPYVGDTNAEKLLQALKASYDPDNFFHLNNSIAPSAGA